MSTNKPISFASVQQRQALRLFLQQHDLSSIGALEVALDSFPREAKLLCKCKQPSQADALVRQAVQTEAVVRSAFDRFFQVCIGDDGLYTYLQSFALDIKFYSQIFAQCGPTFSTFFDDAAHRLHTVNSFYAASSFGKLNLTFDIQSVYTASKGSSYYENYSATATSGGESYTQYGDELLLVEVLTYLEGTLDLTRYDTNGDDVIDAVYLIYNNPIDYDEADFWWAYVNWYFGDKQFDGKDAYYYLFAGFDFINEDADDPDGVEYVGTISGLTINAATFIHETAHLLGVDDYYDYDPDTGANLGLNGADMMDCTAGDHNVYTKTMLGWLTPTVVTQTTTFTIDLSNSSTDDDCIMVLLDSNNSFFCEYLLIDLYSATGLNRLHAEQEDSYLYCGQSFGARIYHVSSWCDDPFRDSYSSFTNYNNSVSKYALLWMVQADGGVNSDNDEDDLADAEDLWQTGDVFSDVYANYTRNDGKLINFDISFDSVTATTATVTITFTTEE